jgi:hypothetical protein
MIGGFGGGFFFAPFTFSFQYAANVPTAFPNAGVPGPWYPLIDPLPTSIRWIDLKFTHQNYGGGQAVDMYFQLGLAPGGSAAGSETVFQPTNGFGFLFSPGSQAEFQYKDMYSYNFPASIISGQRLSVRINAPQLGTLITAAVIATLWG